MPTTTTMTESDIELGLLNKLAHANFCMRCLYGLPASMAEADSSRVAVGFYCLGALDILGLLDAKLSAEDREAWRAWIWAQQVMHPRLRSAADEPRAVGSRERAREGGGGGGDKGADVDSVRTTSTLARRGEAVGQDPSESDDDDDDSDEGHIGGFRPGPFMDIEHAESPVPAPQSRRESTSTVDPDPPHLIMTYTALLALAILRDDFTALDRQGLIGLLRATQKEDGSFGAIPGQGEADIRMVYTAFAISAMLDDWRGVDVPRALAFVRRCASYEGGFGQAPGNEAQGGPTYCALATLALAPRTHGAEARLDREEWRRAERWLVQQQRQGVVQSGGLEAEDQDEGEEAGGFGGRTEKEADACYSFWCGAALRILRSEALGGETQANGVLVGEGENDGKYKHETEEGAEKADFVERLTHARFLSRCQFRLGGLAKAPGAHPDPYHTYLALAALSLYPPYAAASLPGEVGSETRVPGDGERKRTKREREVESWRLPHLDPLINATAETARWARLGISGKGQG